jgi:pimeloyl-ACP methyl ester carboxylesterase
MLKLIPMLADPASFGRDPADAFDVVVPSLPGYGLSDRPTEPGMDPVRIAGLWRTLMVDGLGYPRFGVQGGDWGASVSTRLALQAPNQVAGVHLNYVPGSYRPFLGPGTPRLSEAEALFLERCEEWSELEGGYAHIQRTKPQTLAYGLHDSPIGLAAWIIEKLRSWSDCDGDLERRWDRDELLTAVMLYWVTGTIGSSMRLYRDASRVPLRFAQGERVRVPCGLALFPAETPANPPRGWVERAYDVVRWTEMPRGGHFAAWEEPQLLADDIRAFFRTLR